MSASIPSHQAQESPGFSRGEDVNMPYKLETTINGHNVMFIFGRPGDRRWNAVAHVDGTKPDIEMPPFSIKGDDPENDAAWRRYNRAEIKAMRVVLNEVIEFIADFTRHSVTAKFSRRAGCSCPCSPGFKLDSAIHVNGRRVSQISIKA